MAHGSGGSGGVRASRHVSFLVPFVGIKEQLRGGLVSQTSQLLGEVFGISGCKNIRLVGGFKHEFYIP